MTFYAAKYRGINFRKHPELYEIGRGEQGVLLAEPYKSEILPFWRFATPAVAQESAENIYDLFLEYKKQKDFVGMDMARKFLQMGFTRSRRYANHASGKKYAKDGTVRPQNKDSESSLKAVSAQIFYTYYEKAKNDTVYNALKEQHKAKQKSNERRVFIATTKNGNKVSYNAQNSHAATHIEDTPKLLSLLQELIPTLELMKDNIYADYDMGRVVGKTDLIKTTDADEIIYAKRKNRSEYTRFVKGKAPQPCRHVAIVLNKISDNEYDLTSAWIGYAVPMFPHTQHATAESAPFWRQHALAWGTQSVLPGTETDQWPWGDA